MRRPSVTPLLVAVTLALAAGPSTAVAAGSTASEERQGAALTAAVNAGERSCRSMSPADFDKIGEYAMGLNFTSTEQHEAMNTRMAAMMGADGERQAHRAMGRSYSGCGTDGRRGGTPGAGMMGSGSADGGTAGGYGGFGAGMMRGSAYGPGATGTAVAVETGLGTGSVVLVALAAALLGGGLVAVMAPRLRRRPRAPGTGAGGGAGATARPVT